MGQEAVSAYARAGQVAAGRGIHQRQKGDRDRPRAHRRSAPPARPEVKERIRQLYEQGLNGYQIAARLRRSPTNVYKHLQLGLKKPRWTDEDNQVLVDGYAAGLSGKEIAARLGRSPRAVYVAMCRYRKAVRADERKRRALRAIGMALKAVRKADIFREVTP